MKIDDTTYRRIVAFVRTMANDCSICLNKLNNNCGNCRSLWARSILQELTAKQDSEYIDYSFYSRVNEIKRILRERNCPLLAREINLHHKCSPQLKRWTLNQMVENGILTRRLSFKVKSKYKGGEKKYFLYSLKKTKGDEK